MSKIKNFSVFFNNNEEFDQILGKTSYYISMQNQVSKLVKNFNPFYVIEFGAGSGNTAARLARENQQLSLVAVDNREELVNYCQNNKELRGIQNLTFIKGDLTNLDTFNFINVDLVLLTYSFNYINDPLENKKDFLKHLFSKMKKGARVLIGDWFLPETKTYEEASVKALYKLRVEEGAQSIFWNVLNGKQDEKSIEEAHEKLEIFKKHHRNLLKNIVKREFIYPVNKNWLIDVAVEVGFTVELSDFINNINDAVVVLRK